MTAEEAFEAIVYRGDSCVPMDGENDTRRMCAEVVSRLPEDVQEWLLSETTHVFIGGYGQDGEMIDFWFPPEEMVEGMIKLRIILLSERLMRMPPEEAHFTIAHEIAHSRLNHSGGGYEAETEADALAGQWGFQEPADRAHVRERYRRGTI